MTTVVGQPADTAGLLPVAAQRPRDGIGRRVGLLTLGTSVVKGSQMVVAVLLVRWLSVADWGTVALALSVYLAAITLGSLNLQQSLVFFLPLADPSEQRSLVARTAAVLAAVGIGFAAVVTAGAALAGGIGRMSVTIVALVGVAVACDLPTVCAPALFVARGRWAAGARWDVSMTLVQVAAMVLPAVAGRGAVAVLAGLAAASVVRVVGFVLTVARLPGVRRPVAAGTLRRQLVYCVPLGFTMATGVLTRSVDKWLVAWVDPAEVGTYVIAAQEIPVLSVLPYAGGAAVVVELVRRFAAGEPAAAHALWARQAATMSAVVVPISMFLVAAAPELFDVVFPSEYRSGVFAFRCFTLIGLHRVTEYGIVLRAADRAIGLVRSGIVLLVANAVLGAGGAVLWGANGVALGCLAAYVVGWAYMLRLLGGIFGTRWTGTFPWRSWSAAVGTAAVATVIAVGAAELAASTELRLAVKATVFVGGVAVARRLARRSVGRMSFTNNEGADRWELGDAIQIDLDPEEPEDGVVVEAADEADIHTEADEADIHTEADGPDEGKSD